MNAIGKRRLLKLADFLEELPKERRFDMAHFADAVRDGRPACGTAACAAGWAASIPSFRNAGYRLVSHPRRGIYPVVGDALGWPALEQFFGLNRIQVCEIFDTYDPRTGRRNPPYSAKAAARRIRRLVAREQARADAANKRCGSAKRA